MLEVFQEQQVHLVTQAANDLNLTFVVSSEHAYRLVQHLHGLLVDKFAGGVFGETWERLTGGGAPSKTLPKPWWVKKKAQLLEIGAQRDATYVYDRESIEKRDRRRCAALRAVDAVFYAMKANPHREILRLVHDGGLNFECVSPGEIARVLEVLPSIDRKRILFTPNFAPRSEYEQALEQGVWVTLDNLFPLRQWAKSLQGQGDLRPHRYGPGPRPSRACAHGRRALEVRHPAVRDRRARRLRANKAGARIVGLHAHTGSGVLNAERGSTRAGSSCSCSSASRRPLHRRRRRPRRAREERTTGLDLPALDRALQQVKQGCGDRALWLEPGRFVVAQAGVS